MSTTPFLLLIIIAYRIIQAQDERILFYRANSTSWNCLPRRVYSNGYNYDFKMKMGSCQHLYMTPEFSNSTKLYNRETNMTNWGELELRLHWIRFSDTSGHMNITYACSETNEDDDIIPTNILITLDTDVNPTSISYFSNTGHTVYHFQGFKLPLPESCWNKPSVRIGFEISTIPEGITGCSGGCDYVDMNAITLWGSRIYTYSPTMEPTTAYPTSVTNIPSISPTLEPTIEPTLYPSVDPTKSTGSPTSDPTTGAPSSHPTSDPTSDPTWHSTMQLSIYPTMMEPPDYYPTMAMPASEPTSDIYTTTETNNAIGLNLIGLPICVFVWNIMNDF